MSAPLTSHRRAAISAAATRWKPSGAASAAIAAGLLVTAAFALVSLDLYNRNERRLLHGRARELAAVLAATVPTTQTPLASAAELAAATDGSRQKFTTFMKAYAGPGRQFASASLWRLKPAPPAPLAVVGATPVLLSMPAEEQRLLARAHPGVLSLTGVMGSSRPTLGFEFGAANSRPRFAVYAEAQLPTNRRSAIERNSAFSDLYYVLYLGHSRRNADLVVTNVDKLPIHGGQASEVVPFGAGAFTLVVAAKGSLGGAFFRDLPWLIGIVGAMLALAAGVTADRLAQRRLAAERLAGELDRVATQTRDLYREQRGIAQTLQHALLPDAVADIGGFQTRALYVPATSGVDVGGDWYDIVAVGDRRVVLIIGDVSGHGLDAATTMALMRHAALAYAAQDPRPASVLRELSTFVHNRDKRDFFATVLCALIDAEAHRLSVASAGHLAPLLLEKANGGYVDLDNGPAIGVAQNGLGYRESTTTLPAGGTLVAFTDGLVERRGEVIDVGLARLAQLAVNQQLPLDQLIAKLARDLVSDNHHDDTAIVGIRWTA
ncbi:MAG TPA: PP2C family protein-serine/threonine phosphatase [Solirubrobacteraceae bacterium]|jgi:serine phosphatase RsbU (regulator of sigma subunit)|nr:PP2C family protein-serine/threonine phosphatase [Solirubrobacteraceae bacterium]